MEKKPQDYLHLYLGCEVIHPALKNPRKLTGRWLQSLSEKGINVKPILSPLSEDYSNDMEKQEYDEYKELCNWINLGVATVMVDSPESFRWLLKKGFDVFGLIGEGLAIDKTKIKI